LIAAGQTAVKKLGQPLRSREFVADRLEQMAALNNIANQPELQTGSFQTGAKRAKRPKKSSRPL